MPRKARSEMTLTERHLLILAGEAAEVQEWTVGSIDHYPDGRVFEWPAIDPAECSSILMTWLEEGLIELDHCTSWTEPTSWEPMEPNKARAFLVDHQHWAEHIGSPCLSLTKRGEEEFELTPKRRPQPGH